MERQIELKNINSPRINESIQQICQAVGEDNDNQGVEAPDDGEDQQNNKNKQQLPDQLQAQIDSEMYKINIPLKSIYICNNTTFPQIPANLKASIHEIRGYLKEIIQTWDIADINRNKYSIFQLPESVFIGESQKINYVDVQRHNENIDQVALSSEQLGSIWRDATFQVMSKEFNFPYQWKLHPCIIRGYINRLKSYFFDLSLSYRHFYYIPNRIYQQKKQNTYSDCCQYPQIVNGLLNIAAFPFQLVIVLLGMPGWYYHNLTHNCQVQMEQERLEKLRDRLSQQSQEELELLFYLYKDVMYKNLTQAEYEAKGMLKLINNVVFFKNKKQIEKLARHVDSKVNAAQLSFEEKFNSQDEQYYINIEKEQYALQKQMIMSSQDVSEGVKKSLLCYIQALHIITKHRGLASIELEKLKKNDLLEKIKREHPIRARFMKWHVKQMAQWVENERKRLERIASEAIEKDMKEANLNVILELWRNYQQEKDKPIPQELRKRMKKQQFEPIVTVKVKRKMLTPSICQYNQKNEKGDMAPFYYLEKNTYYNIPSTFPFWKFAVFFVRWWAWGFTASRWLIKNAFIRQFGLRSLWGMQPYYKFKKINHQTGAVEIDTAYGKVSPVLYVFKKVIQGIKLSRKQFEDAPDKGLFSKKIGRICNLIENYLFRFFFVGIIIVLIGMPTLILVLSPIFLVLGLSCFVWMPVFLALLMVFQLLIFDFDSKNKRRWRPLRIPEYFPVFSIIANLLVKGVLQIVWSLGLLVLHIFLIFFFLIWSMIRWCARTMYDAFMYIIVQCCGRVPETNSKFAWKIAGPGISQNYFQSLAPENVYLLFRRQLESLQLTKYQEEIIKAIENPRKMATDKANYIMKALGGEYTQEIQTMKVREDLLKTTVRELIENRRKMYPQFYMYNVRFTEKEIAEMVPITCQIVKIFITNNKMDYIWAQNKVKPGDWNKLNKTFWKEIFSSEEVLEPIEELEQRFQIKRKKGDDEFTSISNAIKGKANLTRENEILLIKPKITVQYQPVTTFISVQHAVETIQYNFNRFTQQPTEEQSIIPDMEIWLEKQIQKEQQELQQNLKQMQTQLSQQIINNNIINSQLQTQQLNQL